MAIFAVMVAPFSSSLWHAASPKTKTPFRGFRGFYSKVGIKALPAGGLGDGKIGLSDFAQRAEKGLATRPKSLSR